MTKINDIKKGVIIFGFKLLKKENLKNQDIVYYQLEHLYQCFQSR